MMTRSKEHENSVHCIDPFHLLKESQSFIENLCLQRSIYWHMVQQAYCTNAQLPLSSSKSHPVSKLT